MSLKKRKESFLTKALGFLLDFLAPKRCPGCGRFVYGDGPASGWCPKCWKSLPWIGPSVCEVCGIPIYGTICQDCLVSEPPFSKLRAACSYEGVIADAVINLKFHHNLSLLDSLSSVLNHCMEEYFRNDTPDIIVPVPLHQKRLMERGFNQSLLLGERLARKRGVRFLRDIVMRERYTVPQVRLSGVERRKNLRNAFKIKPDAINEIQDKSVLIVDDVITTGTTIKEIAKVLKNSGAARVMGIAVARSI